MPAPATKHTLSDYPQLSITAYRKQLQGKEAHSLAMSYQYKGKAYRYNIELLKTPCNYGRYRYWWSCPKCAKRVGKLYCAGLYVCRHCIGANYQTQHMQPWHRPDARMQAIRKRLGWDYSMYQPKPKGMHRATHKRLFLEYIDIEGSYMSRLRSIDKLINAGVIRDTHQLREWKQKK